MNFQIESYVKTNQLIFVDITTPYSEEEKSIRFSRHDFERFLDRQDRMEGMNSKEYWEQSTSIINQDLHDFITLTKYGKNVWEEIQKGIHQICTDYRNAI